MKHKRGEMKQGHMQWRRDRIIELSSKGKSEREIATILQIAPATAHRDIIHKNQQARENIRGYIDEELPAEYGKCLVGITSILKEAWNTADSAAAPEDRRDRLQALSLAKECYAMKLDLLSSATVVERAVKFVKNHRNSNNQDRGFMPQKDQVLIDNDNIAGPR